MKALIFVLPALAFITACGDTYVGRESKIQELESALDSTYLEQYEVLYHMPHVCGTSVQEAEGDLQKFTKRIEEADPTLTDRDREIASKLDEYLTVVGTARDKISGLRATILRLEDEFQEITDNQYIAPPMPNSEPDSADPFAQ